ncbi:Uncharacterized protein ToN1_04850 [Aromatoleum petrolei]|nr:Uncharacterized protein ToN1_04850 [Aromatoleum petrolei]
MIVASGQPVGAIHGIPSVAELMDRLIAESCVRQVNGMVAPS